jgi:DmsE family decaheme c-type cytochrome
LEFSSGDKEMGSWKIIKLAAILGVMLALFVWFTSSTPLQVTKSVAAETKSGPVGAKNVTSEYVGSDACKDCHEDQFKDYTHTAHAKLTSMGSWKDKVTGCESCHGPGKKHIDEADPKQIISFKNKTSKEISETCLACHAGREEHNNFRRGEHWRNDVGCTECHSSHGTPGGRNVAASNTFIAANNAEKPGFSTVKMLKVSEPQLCLACHSEIKHQFNMPFRHKVLEGAMKCSDCHNAHGGFETKQTRLATGADGACVKCHADKQGPFTYEHAPVKTEGCNSCHTPHGSSNPRLLRTSSVSQLCLECHSVDHGVGAVEPSGPQHNLNAQYAQCTACHLKIHGSRSSPVFFR